MRRSIVFKHFQAYMLSCYCLYYVFLYVVTILNYTTNVNCAFILFGTASIWLSCLVRSDRWTLYIIAAKEVPRCTVRLVTRLTGCVTACLCVDITFHHEFVAYIYFLFSAGTGISIILLVNLASSENCWHTVLFPFLNPFPSYTAAVQRLKKTNLISYSQNLILLHAFL